MLQLLNCVCKSVLLIDSHHYQNNLENVFIKVRRYFDIFSILERNSQRQSLIKGMFSGILSPKAVAKLRTLEVSFSRVPCCLVMFSQHSLGSRRMKSGPKYWKRLVCHFRRLLFMNLNGRLWVFALLRCWNGVKNTALVVSKFHSRWMKLV